MSELKPCPICGGEAYDHKVAGYIGCDSTGCDARAKVYYNSLSESWVRDRAIAAWNNRPLEAALEARIAELEAENAALKAEFAERFEKMEQRQGVIEDVLNMLKAANGKGDVR